MIEVFTMALHQSNIIINILLVSAFLLNLVFAFIIIFMEAYSKFYMGVVIGFSFSTFSRIHIVFIIRSPNTERTYI